MTGTRNIRDITEADEASEGDAHIHWPVRAAACEAENAFRALARMSLHLDRADLEVEDAVAHVIEDVGDIATGLAQIAENGRCKVALHLSGAGL